MTEPSRPAAIEDLLAHADWLRALARRLVAGDDVASDVEQETWLAALENPPRDAAAPRKWLAQVLRNIVKQRRRSESARRAREKSVARPEATSSGMESIDRAQSLRALIDCVLELDEPYGSTILLHYQDGLSFDEIARQQSVAPSTVRNRVARGLAQLRERLKRRHGDAWSAILIPLIPHKAAVGVALASTAATITTMTSIKLASAVAALFAVGAAMWWGYNYTAPTTPVAQAQQSTQSMPKLDEPFSTKSSVPAVAEDVRQAVAPQIPATSSTSGSLSVTVTWESDGTPASDVFIHLDSDEDPSPTAFEASRRTDERGRAQFDDVPSGSNIVKIPRAMANFVQINAGARTELALKIPRGMLVNGRVVDSAGAPVGFARIWLSGYGNYSMGNEVTETDEAGRFVLRDVGEGRCIAARASGFSPSLSTPLRGEPGEALDLVIRMRTAGAELRGVVRAPDGSPVIGAALIVGDQETSVVSTEDGAERYSPPSQRLRSDVNGEFLASGIDAGSIGVMCRAPGFAPYAHRFDATAGGTTQVILELQPGAALSGIVRGVDGNPASGVGVSVQSEARFLGTFAKTAIDGTFHMDALGHGKAKVQAGGDVEGQASASVILTAGATAQLELQLEKRGLVSGMVIDGQGAPLAGWRVGAISADNPGLHLRSSITDAEGKFILDNWPEKANALEVRVADRWTGSAALTVRPVEVGSTDLVLTVPSTAMSMASVVGRLLGPDGMAAKDAELMFGVCGISGHIIARPSATTGEFRLELSPGCYEFFAQSPSLGMSRVPDHELHAGETLDLGVIRFSEPARLHVKLVGARGVLESVGAPNIRVYVPEPARLGDGRIELDDKFEGLSRPLGAGPHTIEVRGTFLHAAPMAIELVAGETRSVEIAVETATWRLLQISWASGAPPKEPFDVTVTAADGNLFSKVTYPASEQEPTTIGLASLLNGSYSVDVRTADGRTGRTAFTVSELAPMDPRIPGGNVIEVQVR